MERAAAPNFGHGDPMVGRWLRSRFGGDDEQRDPRRPLTGTRLVVPLRLPPPVDRTGPPKRGKLIFDLAELRFCDLTALAQPQCFLAIVWRFHLPRAC